MAAPTSQHALISVKPRCASATHCCRSSRKLGLVCASNSQSSVIERFSYRRSPIKKAGILVNSLRLCEQDFLYGSLMPGLSCSRWTGRRMRPHRRPPLRAPWTRIEAPPPRLISAEHHRCPPAMLGRPSHGAPRADLVACRRGRVGRRDRASLRRLRLERQSSGRTAPCYPELLLPPRAPATMDHVAYMDNPPDPFNHCWNRYASFRLLALAIKK
jgi:hypothetical protein